LKGAKMKNDEQKTNNSIHDKYIKIVSNCKSKNHEKESIEFMCGSCWQNYEASLEREKSLLMASKINEIIGNDDG
jgi:hypothetical protein